MSSFAANSVAVDVRASGGTWLLTVGGTPPVAVPHDVDPTTLANLIEPAVDVPVRVWREAAAPERLWITFAGEIPEVLVDSSGLIDGSATVVGDFHDFGEQVEASATCRQAGLTGEDCWSSALGGLIPCALATGGWPPVHERCNQGALLAVQSAVRPAVDDVQSAVRWLRDRDDLGDPAYPIDTSIVLATGQSAGGLISMALAFRLDDWTGPGEDPAGPNSALGNDARIQGAAPYSGGFAPNGTGQLPVDAPPVAIVQHDVDVALWVGAFQTFSRRVLSGTRGAVHPVEYLGLCGPGHGGAPSRSGWTEQAQTSQIASWDATTVAIARFFHPIVSGDASPHHDREGVWYGGDTPRTWTEGPAAELIGNATPHVGDFDGDGVDDIYWRSTDSSGDSVWLGMPDGT